MAALDRIHCNVIFDLLIELYKIRFLLLFSPLAHSSLTRKCCDI